MTDAMGDHLTRRRNQEGRAATAAGVLGRDPSATAATLARLMIEAHGLDRVQYTTACVQFAKSRHRAGLPEIPDRELLAAYGAAAHVAAPPDCDWMHVLDVPGAPKAPKAGADLVAEIVEDAAAGRIAALPWPGLPGLSEASQALVPGSIALVCGVPGGGKSWFMLQTLAGLVESGTNAAMLALEETLGWHLRRALAQRLEMSGMARVDWLAANPETARRAVEGERDWLNDMAKRITARPGATIGEVGDWIEGETSRGRRVVIVDPVTLADPGGAKPWEADRALMTRAKAAADTHGASVVLVTHPAKSGPRNGPPSMDNLAGGAAYARAASCVLWLAPGEGGAVEVTLPDGQVAEVRPDKVAAVFKTRNGMGGGRSFALAFDRLRLSELGRILTKAEREEAARAVPMTRRRPVPASRQLPPGDAEDLFNVGGP